MSIEELTKDVAYLKSELARIKNVFGFNPKSDLTGLIPTVEAAWRMGFKSSKGFLAFASRNRIGYVRLSAKRIFFAPGAIDDCKRRLAVGKAGVR